MTLLLVVLLMWMRDAVYAGIAGGALTRGYALLEHAFARRGEEGEGGGDTDDAVEVDAGPGCEGSGKGEQDKGCDSEGEGELCY